MRYSGRTALTAIAMSVATLVSAAVANHGSVIYNSATCDPVTNTITVFGTNTSSSPAGFVANVSVNGGAVFQTPIIFDADPGAIPGNSSGSFNTSDPLYTFGASVVLTNNFSATGAGAGSSVTAICGAATPLTIPTLSDAGMAALLALLALAGFAAIRFKRQ